jgi:hypothetical protein
VRVDQRRLHGRPAMGAHHCQWGARFTTDSSVHPSRGEAEVFKAGAAWVNQPGLIHAEGNAGQVIAQVAATFLLPEGAPLTTA